MARKSGSHSKITGPRVRAAAETLIAQHGFAAVSMRQIAAEVGVQAGALYLYTPDKQTLLFELMRDHLDEILDHWSASEPPDAPIARLEHFVRFHIGINQIRQNAVFIAYMELRNLREANREKISAQRRAYEQIPEQIIRDGAEAGVFSVDDPKLTALAVIAMLNGVNTWFREDGRLSRAEVEDRYWEMVRRVVGA